MALIKAATCTGGCNRAQHEQDGDQPAAAPHGRCALAIPHARLALQAGRAHPPPAGAPSLKRMNPGLHLCLYADCYACASRF